MSPAKKLHLVKKPLMRAAFVHTSGELSMFRADTLTSELSILLTTNRSKPKNSLLQKLATLVKAYDQNK